jgi:hypothetical protein
MNITEAQAVSTLIDALHGRTVEQERVSEAASFCKDRIHKALFASPAINIVTVEMNTQLLQQEGWKA